ncbi:MAG: hypothetical protein JEZ06_09665 [Anaerolineaceae bacterium]|nr:hypothetical protein [Anaerolineaceae bacterium]
MKFPAVVAIVMGVGMIGQWGMFIITGQVPELQSEPVAIAFHLAAEFLTAIALITGGVALLKRVEWARPISFVAYGMLLYTAVVSPGYFGQLGQWAFVGMFAVILIFALISVFILLRAKTI